MQVRTVIKLSRLLVIAIVLFFAAAMVCIMTLLQGAKKSVGPTGTATAWRAPDTNQLSRSPEDELIRYGKRLVAATSFYLGPKGSIAVLSNGMNCQNCHLEAGTRAYGNNYSAVFSTYPKFRERSGTVETIYKRINDCMERSLNGKSLDTGSREMQAIYAYMKWLGQNLPKNTKPPGAGIRDIPFAAQAADPVKGQMVYMDKCRRCHGEGGEGLLNKDSVTYGYPPLWGMHSYTSSAGLYRISRFAGYVRDNMPLGASHDAPQLTDEEAWNVAAFVNSQPRPQKIFSKDWPDISAKPIDYPFGPYADSFPESRHKYGPFAPIQQAKQRLHAGSRK